MLFSLRKKREEEKIAYSKDIQNLTNKSLEQKAEQTTILDALNEGLLIVDSQKKIIFANKSIRELFGQRSIINKQVDYAFLDESIPDIILKGIHSKENVNECVIVKYNINSPLSAQQNKNDSYWRIDIAPIQSTHYNQLFRVILRDETSQYQLEQIRKDFVANASHELRTPLAIIEGYIENLLEEGIITENPTMARKFLEIMQRHSGRISRIIEDMLVVSRLESGEAAALNKNVFPLKECIQDVIERLESVIRKQGAEVTLKITDPNLQIEADRFYITQVLFNLIENALKQNANAPVHVNVTCATDEQYITISIEDNGIGIPSSDLNHIFRRFYRVQKHHSQSEIKGTGLGLSIVKRAIEAHGGNISVTSTPGKSTDFRILFPKELSKPASEL